MPSAVLQIEDLQTMPYRAAWAYQESVHAAVADGAPERLLFVEHPPVITFGRRGNTPGNLLASEEYLSQRGVELVESDRGGDITFHGPGQLVAYPIIRLNDHGLSVGAYVRALERACINALADLGIMAKRIDGAVGIWVDDQRVSAKICAIGVRIRRGVSLHGLALNVGTDLNYFKFIVPCGLTGKPVTSIRRLLGDSTPAMSRVQEVLAVALNRAFSQARSSSIAECRA